MAMVVPRGGQEPLTLKVAPIQPSVTAAFHLQSRRDSDCQMWEFDWSLFLRVRLVMIQHWFRWWLGADQATNHYLNQCWSSLMRYIWGTRLQGIKVVTISLKCVNGEMRNGIPISLSFSLHEYYENQCRSAIIKLWLSLNSRNKG